MKRSRIFFPALCAALLVGPTTGSAEVDYNRDIRPILSQNCFACHGPDAEHRKAKLRLDTEEGSRDAITPGDVEDSELIYRLVTEDADEIMPPPKTGKSLKPEEIELLKTWIKEGAKYSEAWTYIPPVRHEVPEVKDAEWPINWVDRFVLSRLEKEGWKPAPDADPTTLIRRLYFDLTGLPPAPEEVDAFVANPTLENYEAIVDKLLASEAYGERMAIYWLDLVRFADTVGYHGDQDQNITPYRDYVIDAFNRNLPFDQFTREQLAGDLLENPTIDQLVATGYNRMLQTSHEGGVQPKEYLAIYAADRIRNLSGVWMGGTLGCAQCHDHKYDPYTIKDFYAMSAFFADIDEAQHFKVGSNSLPTKRPPEIKVLSRKDREYLAQLEEDLKTAKPKDKKFIEAAIERVKTRERLTMVTASIKPRITRILPRGNWLDDSGEIVEPAIPEFLGTIKPSKGGRATRLDLANWLVDPKEGRGGLTARVYANRFWYLFFGQGISTSLDDFGGQGTPPVDPELLDTLAVDFYENGWDIKRFVKLLVTSRAYRQSSKASDKLLEEDTENLLFARQSRYRLPAEMVRDNALAISGLLVEGTGGKSAKPYQPEGYYRHLNFPTRKYSHDTDENQWRRGVYMHWQRQFLHPMLRAMDAPSREECTARRPRSNTPTAAMVLLNDPSFVEAARVFAARILREGGKTDKSRLEFAWKTALSRLPDDEERKILGELFKAARAEYIANEAGASALASVGQAPRAEGLDPAEHAVWTTMARAILNLGETNNRN